VHHMNGSILHISLYLCMFLFGSFLDSSGLSLCRVVGGVLVS
jgi:hypothetical protein